MDLDDIPDLSAEFQMPDLCEYAMSGIYLLLEAGEVVYVGQARDMRRRVADHLATPSKVFDGVRFLPCHTSQLNKIERRYIEAYQPKLNNCGFSNTLRVCKVPLRPLEIKQGRERKTRSRKLIAM